MLFAMLRSLNNRIVGQNEPDTISSEASTQTETPLVTNEETETAGQTTEEDRPSLPDSLLSHISKKTDKTSSLGDDDDGTTW